MKNVTTFAMALALVTGVSATVLSVDSASARGWFDGDQQGQGWKGNRGPQKGMRGSKGKRGGAAMMMFKEFDANNDKALTKEELTSGLEKKIADNDKDGDKAVSLEEFKAEWAKMTEQRMVRAFQRMDRDGSGKVTLEEIKEPALNMFERADRNNDDKIDASDRKERRMGMRGWFNNQKPAAQPAPAPEAQ